MAERARTASGAASAIARVEVYGYELTYAHGSYAMSEGRVLADLPPEPFFADPVIIETVVGKRRGH